MSDFCLGSRAMTCIARRSYLMRRMCARAGIAAEGVQSAEPGLWYEARLRCLGCALSERCNRFLASPNATGQYDVPDFCVNRTFFAEQGRSRYVDGRAAQ